MSYSVPTAHMFHAACADYWRRRRGKFASMDSRFEKDLMSDSWLVALKVDGKVAKSRIERLGDVPRVINEMIDEIYPLELE